MKATLTAGAFLIASLFVLIGLGAATATFAQEVTTASALSSVPPDTPVVIATGDTIIEGSEWYDVVRELALTLVSLVVTVLLGIVTPMVIKFIGEKNAEAARKLLHSAATTAAGAILARFEGKFSEIKFDTKNPAVADAVDWVREKGAQSAVDKLKASETDVANVILGKIGQMQAGASAGAASPSNLQNTVTPTSPGG